MAALLPFPDFLSHHTLDTAVAVTDGSKARDAVPTLVPEKEAKRQAYLSVTRLAIALRQSPRTVWVAMTYFHRFFLDTTVGEFPPCLFAATCLLVASKLTEKPLSVRDLVSAFEATMYPGTAPLNLSTGVPRVKAAVVLQEQHLLRKLRFQLDVVTPHSFLLHYSKSFGFGPASLRLACGLLNDTLASGAAVKFNAHHLAVASLVVASKQLGEPQVLPAAAGLAGPRKWYAICDITDRQLADASAAILSAYSDLPAE